MNFLILLYSYLKCNNNQLKLEKKNPHAYFYMFPSSLEAKKPYPITTTFQFLHVDVMLYG